MATVSNESVSYLQQLPVEILFQIFENLDAVTLLLFLAQTCRRLRTLVHSFDRLSVDFTLLSKPHFHCLLRLLNPHHVTSLTLTHQPETADAVTIFCSHYRRRPFDRLRSLALHRFAGRDLRNVLKRFQLTSLSSLTLKPDHPLHRRTRATADVIATIIANPTIRRLEIDIGDNYVKRIQWPNPNVVKQLKIHGELRIEELSHLLTHLPHLQILSVTSIGVDARKKKMKVEGSTEKFRQLTSLTLTRFCGSIDDLEYLLSLTSSLTHLKLVGFRGYEDGKRWEQFIQRNLPHLEKFEFFFTIISQEPVTSKIGSIMSPFRTPFWLEQKKWIVQDDQSRDYCNTFSLKLYSLPICIDTYACQMGSHADAVHYSFIEDSSWMDNITTLEWNVKESVDNGAEEKGSSPSNRLMFRNVKTLTLLLDAKRPTNWIKQLSSFVALETISKVSVSISYGFGPELMKIDDVGECLRLMPNLQSLDIQCSFWHRPGWSPSPSCLMIPSSVRHLTLSTGNYDDCFPCLERFDQLWSFGWGFTTATTTVEQLAALKNWLDENRPGSSYENQLRSLHIWLGKERTVPRNKRRKHDV